MTAERAKRIQRKRTKGWRMPEGCVYVGRGSKWGNPFHVGLLYAPDEAVEAYRQHIERYPHLATMVVEELRGKDLACWCKVGPGFPCHADVLLELANAEATP